MELRLLRWNLLIHLHRTLRIGPSGPFGTGSCDLGLTRRPLLLYYRYTASTEGSGASSSNPWAEMEAEITALRRRVHRHGQFLQQLDERGGNRLDNIDEDLGQVKAEFKHALDILEAWLFEKIDTLQARIHKVENEVSKLSDGQHRHRGIPWTCIFSFPGFIFKN